jgi:serine/threonine-protein kinase
MPNLTDQTINDLKNRLLNYLADLKIASTPLFLDAGGSAAIFKVETSEGSRAYKVFDPQFINNNENQAEKRRLELQRKLIGHDCPYMVQTYRVDEAYDTAFIEMEFIEWPQLKKQLHLIPDINVSPLINQLIDAVKFLESREIIHRDIKPENIHISEDFKNLKLLDLGVARELEVDNSAAVTDAKNLRPFLATAQYSSPEYLFRLDEPSKKLWHGLNLYQVGAVLHDLIMKKSLFNEEVSLGNRWLVARAVLTKNPDFNDEQPERLSHLKSVAFRCLTKDIESRISIVSWEDFISTSDIDPIKSLRSRLVKTALIQETQNSDSLRTRLTFDRNNYFTKTLESIRSELHDVCGPELPITVRVPQQTQDNIAIFLFAHTKRTVLECKLSFIWKSGLQERTTDILLSSKLIIDNQQTPDTAQTAICCGYIDTSDSVAELTIVKYIAKILAGGIDIIETAENIEKINGLDLIQL